MTKQRACSADVHLAGPELAHRDVDGQLGGSWGAGRSQRAGTGAEEMLL